jgi:hypothetical protein
MKGRNNFILTMILVIVLILCITNVNAQNETNSTEDFSMESNETTDDFNVTTNETNTTETNTTEEIEPTSSFIIKEFSPENVTLGTTLFTLTIENNGTENYSTISPIISGEGFATFESTQITSLTIGEEVTTYIRAITTKIGEILLTIKINDETFYETILVKEEAEETTVLSDNEVEEKAQQEEEEITFNLGILNEGYNFLTNDYYEMESDFILDDVNFDKLEEYLASVEANLLAGDIMNANISFILAEKEYNKQLQKVVTADKKTFFDKLEDNILLISTFAGAFITLLTFYEIMKRKQAKLYKKIKEFQINPTTKVEVHQRKEDDEEVEEKKESDKKEEEKTTEERVKEEREIPANL